MRKVETIARGAADRIWVAEPAHARKAPRPRPANGLAAVAESADRRRLLIADWLEPNHAGGAAWVWEPSTSRVAGAPWSQDRYGNISDGVFTSDGRALIATAEEGDLGVLCIWDLDPWRERVKARLPYGDFYPRDPEEEGVELDDDLLQEVSDAGPRVAVSPDGALAAVVSEPWDGSNGADEELAAMCREMARRAHVLSTETGDVIASLDAGEPTGRVAIHPSGEVLALVTARGAVQLWSLPGEEAPRVLGVSRELEGSADRENVDVVFSPDGAWLGAGTSRSVCLWQVGARGASLREGVCRAMPLAPRWSRRIGVLRGRLLVAEAGEGRARLEDPAGERTFELEGAGQVDCLRFTPALDALLTGNTSEVLRWSLDGAVPEGG